MLFSFTSLQDIVFRFLLCAIFLLLQKLGSFPNRSFKSEMVRSLIDFSQAIFSFCNILPHSVPQGLLRFQNGGEGKEFTRYTMEWRFRRLFARSTAVKRPKRFSFYLVGFYLMLSENMGKDV